MKDSKLMELYYKACAILKLRGKEKEKKIERVRMLRDIIEADLIIQPPLDLQCPDCRMKLKWEVVKINDYYFNFCICSFYKYYTCSKCGYEYVENYIPPKPPSPPGPTRPKK